jgi:eukaryotic-like serine/threonine-protein kinase
VGDAALAMADEFEGTDRFLIIRRIGAGGMGVVYEALDRDRNARVALKTLRTLKPDAILRFKNEFRSLSDLHHPNLASLGELFEHEGQWFFTMELVRGVHFLDYVRKTPQVTSSAAAGPMTTDEQPTNKLGQGVSEFRNDAPEVEVRLPSGVDEIRLRGAMAQLALGLVELHRARKVHRDIKPSNILITPEGRVVILDFGLVADLVSASQESHLVGTFSYMAPEQASMKPVGAAADWYSVGVLLYQALTSRLPVTGNAREVLILKQAFEPPPPSSLALVPEDLDQLCADLLRIDPAARPPSREILRRLHAEDRNSLPDAYGVAHFVGRTGEIGELRRAFGAVLGGAGVTVLLHGDSGVGKSALVRRFAVEISTEHPKTLVFAGRCYERESVPYKAVDGVIDALSRHLTALKEDELRPLLPRQRGLIGQVFPVMRKVEAIAEAPRPLPGQLDPQVLRARLFFALRDLFTRIADRQPLLLVIDDLQWADADSLALLAEIMRGPEEPKLLLIGTMRAALKTELRRLEEGEASVQRVEQVASVFSGDVRRLTIEALPREDARALVDALLRDAGAGDDVSAGELADEAGGHPLFIDELVRQRIVAGESGSALRLEDALQARVARLDEASRRLLELVAVAGAPLVQDTAAHAAKVDFSAFAQEAAALRAQNLVRTTGVRKSDAIEPYHDRVREAVLVSLSPVQLRAWHGRLAVALEAAEHADPEALATHWRGGGDLVKASGYAVRAAQDAADALAFDRAARLYALALELRPLGGMEGSALRAKLGDALANAGRGAEAAAAFLAAAEPRPPAEALDLRRRAAEQLLRSGHIDEAMATFRTVLAAVGMDMPETSKSALVSLLFRRTQVRLRGLNFKERPEREIPSEDLTRIDTCWAVSAGLALVDTIIGSYFQSRCLLLALEAGEPHRVARALAIEAGYSSASGGSSAERTAELLRATQTLARRLEEPYTLGWASAAEGVTASLEGRWKIAHDACERAESIFRDRCRGVAWEIASMRWFSLWSLSYLGGLAELAERVPVRLREAKERGDLYATICHSTGLANLVWLAQDDAAQARERSREALRVWSQRKFHVEHWWAMLSDRQIELYEGDGEAAYRAIEEQWSALSGSLLLMVQLTKLEALHLHARAALLLATQKPAQKKALLKVALSDAQKIEKEDMPWSNPLSALLRAGVAAAEGDGDRAVPLLHAAGVGLDRANMSLYASAARYQRGRLLKGEEGRTLREQAEAALGRQGVKNLGKMVRMLAPGFAEG